MAHSDTISSGEPQFYNEHIMDLSELKEKRPELFEPIPLIVGRTADNPKGFETGLASDWRGIENPINRIEVIDNGEPLVNVASGSRIIFCTNDYAKKLDNSPYGERLPETYLTSFARETVYNKLQQAQELLPRGYRIIAFDLWRSLGAQYAAYRLCFKSLVDKMVTEGVLNADHAHHLSPEEEKIISNEVQKYISLPLPLPAALHPSPDDVAVDRQTPSPHNTGGAVDVGIARVDKEKLKELEDIEKSLLDDKSADDSPYRIALRFRLAAIYRQHSTLLSFGTDFDYAGAESGLTYYETAEGEPEPKYWRRMLYNVMTKVGFWPYSDEWWHYNYGNQMAQLTQWRTTGLREPAIYGNTQLTAAQEQREQTHYIFFEMLQKLAQGSQDIKKLPTQFVDIGIDLDYLKELSAAVGDPAYVRSLGDPHDMVYRGDIPQEIIDKLRDVSRDSSD